MSLSSSFSSTLSSAIPLVIADPASTFVENDVPTLAAAVNAAMTSAPVIISEPKPVASSPPSAIEVLSDIDVVLSSVVGHPSDIDLEATGPAGILAFSTRIDAVTLSIADAPSDPASIPLVPTGTASERLAYPYPYFSGSEYPESGVGVPTTVSDPYGTDYTTIVLWSCTVYPSSSRTSSTPSSSSSKQPHSSSTTCSSSSSPPPYNPSTTTRPPVYPTYPSGPTYITIYTTVYQTVCPPYVPDCPYGMNPHTYTITETCTGDQNDYTPPPLPPNFTTTTTVCGGCEGRPTITVTCPIEPTKDAGDHGQSSGGSGGNNAGDYYNGSGNGSVDNTANGSNDSGKGDSGKGADHNDNNSNYNNNGGDADAQGADKNSASNASNNNGSPKGASRPDSSDSNKDDPNNTQNDSKNNGDSKTSDENGYLEANDASRRRIAETLILAVIASILGVFVWGI